MMRTAARASRAPRPAWPDAAAAWSPRVRAGWPHADIGYSATGAHPLADAAASGALARRAQEIDTAFARIEPALAALVLRQFEAGFPARARADLAESFGVDVAEAELAADWARPLAAGRLYARCAIGTFARLVAREFDRTIARLHEGEDAATLIRRWGFHAIDITPCADGRLAGVVDYVLRVPPAVVAFRKSHAGAMFDVEQSLRHWETVELRRWREGRPNPASEPTRYLKLGVYHFSSRDPRHEGCAAHGSDETRAAEALLVRLQEFAQAVEASHCCGAQVATLLVGVDTDTDAIRVHVPDAAGRMSATRSVCNRTMYEQTATLAREAAKEAIRTAVAECAGVSAEDAATEGMRWFCGYLLKNNLAQVDAVRRAFGGPYPDAGHTERLIVAGDGIDDVQLRNLAFQAQTDTVEEAAFDLDVGVKILEGLHAPRGLAVPVLAHVEYDARMPGAQGRAAARALRLKSAIEARFADRVAAGRLLVQAAVRAAGQPRLRIVEPPAEEARGCRCTHTESHG
jgi:carboxysome shell carbonic anhydrase